MNFFKKYSSNTLAGSGNQYIFKCTNSETINVGRIYYKTFSGGKYNYSFLFSNITDSTYSDGSLSHKNFICDSWDIVALRVGVCQKCSATHAVEPVSFVDATFDSKKSKRVNPGEFFCTDAIELDVKKDEYLCLEISFRGKTIPYHEESIIPSFVFSSGQWIPSKRTPFPGLIGCDRSVDKKIAFLGDSITQGIGTEVNSYEHWNARLAEMLGDKYAYWNLGIGYGRADDAASDGAWLYKAKQNDIVFVCYGVNDILQGFTAERIKKNLEIITSKLKECDIKVILQTIPPFDYDEENTKTHNEVNHFITNELSSYVDAVFDVIPILSKNKNETNMAKFGGHPNSEGCKIWAYELFEFLIKNNLI